MSVGRVRMTWEEAGLGNNPMVTEDNGWVELSTSQGAPGASNSNISER